MDYVNDLELASKTKEEYRELAVSILRGQQKELRIIIEDFLDIGSIYDVSFNKIIDFLKDTENQKHYNDFIV